jgi:hypothetical protein
MLLPQISSKHFACQGRSLIIGIKVTFQSKVAWVQETIKNGGK